MRVNYVIFRTALGWVGILGSPGGLKGLVLPQTSPEQAWALLARPDPKWQRESLNEGRASYFGDLPDRLKSYLSGKKTSFPDRLDLSWASPFQRSVWDVCQSIPYGETRSYAWVAGKLGLPRAARAVGQALARNPVPIIVPCHRVIGSDGELVGFGGGTDLKRLLLRIESEAR